MNVAAMSIPPQDEDSAGNPGPVSAEAYRALMRCFPTGVAIVTGADRTGTPHGMTCTSLTSVTLCPPTLLVCLRQGSATLAAVRERGAFGVNLLRSDASHVAELFSSRATDRFSRVAWQPSDLEEVPWLREDAFALAECRVASFSTVGDHEIVLAEVTSTRQRQDVPLLSGMRRFSAYV